MKTKMKYWVMASLLAVFLFLLFGVITDLIPNPLFTRMVEKTAFDYSFLVISSILFGAYITSHLYYKKKSSQKCNAVTYSGGVGSFLAFSCPICNKLLVLLFGATTLLIYFEPYRPLLGFLSISLLSGALYFKLKRP
jgi:undecaprenyl pyrophosphate phosphatase UppP